ncbi:MULTISPECIES: ImmA/IrrE family metallo-endopeptidase [Aurantimonas]|uniref:ImmA/IrrE family metallo-endopeptidase n=1 Tax=Aurantimonas TaxID=182269 RepID=UPI00351187CE
MQFSVDWLENAPNRALEERATAAELKISIGNSNATLHMMDGVSGGAIEMPVYSLVQGLTLDWWRLFGSREDEISLKHYRSGYAVPDVRMRFDGSTFEVRAEQTVYHNPPVQFWAGQHEVLSRAQAEAVLSEFIDTVLSRLTESSVVGTTAALRWIRIQASLADPEERAFCEAAAALGQDPYAVENDIAETIERSAVIFKGEPLTEFLAGARGKNKQRLFAWIEAVRSMPGYTARLNDLPAIARQAAGNTPAIEGEEAWAHGYRRARAFRKALSLGDQDRTKSVKQLAARLGNANFRAKASVDGIRVLRENNDLGVMLHLRRRESGFAATEQLFSLARGAGDVACFPEPDIAPINDLQHAYRQRCGRAFAAEFLAPVREVRSMWEDGRDTSTIADEFGVSERVIEHQLENGQRIEEVCAA